MKHRKLLKKLIEYEKNLSGFSFSIQALIISLVIALWTNYGVEKHNNSISSKNMDYLIDTSLEDDILVLPLYDEKIDSGLIATGEVLISYLEEYNISATIINNKVLIVPNKNIEELKLDNLNLEEIRKILSYDSVEKNYNLETYQNFWFSNSSQVGKIVLELKK